MAHHLLSERRKLTSIPHEIDVLQIAFLVGVGPLVDAMCNRLVRFDRSIAPIDPRADQAAVPILPTVAVGRQYVSTSSRLMLSDAIFHAPSMRR